MKHILDIYKLSEYLNINAIVIYDWVNRNMIPYRTVNSTTLFNQDEIDQWIEQSKHVSA